MLEKAAARWEAWRADPRLFVREVLLPRDSAGLWEGQSRILESIEKNEETYVRSGHTLGKTFIAAAAALWFFKTFRPSKVITVAPTQRQVKELLWGEIARIHRMAPFDLQGELISTNYSVSADHYMTGFSPKVGVSDEDQGVRFQGRHSDHILVIFDEAPGIGPKIWESSKGVLSGGHHRFLAIGNPTSNAGPFYEAFVKGFGSRIHLSPFDSPNFTANNVRNLEDLRNAAVKPRESWETPWPAFCTVPWALSRMREWGIDSPIFRSRVLGEFPDQAEDSLFPLSALQACKDSEGRRKSKPTLGVDVARFGDDKTAIYGFKDWRQSLREVHSGWDTQRTANRVIRLIQDEGYRVIAVDDVGLGGGVTDRLREWVSSKGEDAVIIPVNNGDAPRDPKFKNLRAETYWSAAEVLKAGAVRIWERGDLFHELTSIRYKFISDGRIQIESKDDMRRRGIKSPNEADALVLALHGLALSAGSREASEPLLGGDRETISAPWEGL